MKRLMLFVWCLCAAGSAEAQSSFLCITDHATGFAFNKSSKQWSSVSFKAGDKYIVSKITPETGKPFDSLKWYVRKFGEPALPQIGFPLSGCKEDFNDVGNLFCDGWVRFYLSKRNLRFFMVSHIGYWSDWPDELTGKNKSSVEGANTPYMEIGKCSPL